MRVKPWGEVTSARLGEEALVGKDTVVVVPAPFLLYFYDIKDLFFNGCMPPLQGPYTSIVNPDVIHRQWKGGLKPPSTATECE